jgi:hypothetical protein
MMNDSFIESVISTEYESTDTETNEMISRELYGMEAVAQRERLDKFAPTEEDD